MKRAMFKNYNKSFEENHLNNFEISQKFFLYNNEDSDSMS